MVVSWRRGRTWCHCQTHCTLQTEKPGGDWHWIDTYSVLEKLVEFDKLIRVEFTHIIRMVAGPSPTAPSDSITSRWEAIRLRDLINTHYCVKFLTIKYVSAFLQAPQEPSLMALHACTSPPGPPSSSTSGQAPAP